MGKWLIHMILHKTEFLFKLGLDMGLEAGQECHFAVKGKLSQQTPHNTLKLSWSGPEGRKLTFQ